MLPLHAPIMERRDRQPGGPITLAERIPAPVDTELAIEARAALAAPGRTALRLAKVTVGGDEGRTGTRVTWMPTAAYLAGK
jgi:hypothetical protein